MKHLRSRGQRNASYETFLAVVGDEGDRCNQRRNKICYKPSTGVGFYFLLWFSKSLVYFITFVSNRQGWHYGQGPPFWLLIGIIWGKKNPRCSEHIPAQLNQKLLMWDPVNSRVSSMCSQFENNQSRVQVWGYPKEKAIDNLKKAKMWNDFEQHVACNKRINVTLLHGAFLCKWPRFGDTGLQLPLHI